MKSLQQIKLYLLCFLVTAFPLFSPDCFAQDKSSCEERLKTAQTLFDRGQVGQVPDLIGNCLRSLSREESLNGYKLLVQSYLLEDQPGLADSTMLLFLKQNPEYTISPTDHSSFSQVFNGFVAKKLIQFSFHFGFNFPLITVGETKSLGSLKGENNYSNESLNLNTSFEAKFQINEKLELNAEIGYSQIAFYKNETFMGFAQNNYYEYQKRIDIPLSVTYDLKNIRKITPYLRAGAGPSFILSTSASSELDMRDENNPFNHTGTDVPRGKDRIPFDLMLQVGGGLKYKVMEGFFFAEFRSAFGVLNQVMPGRQFNGELPWYYYFDDDDFRVNFININAGYTRILYKPSKKKARK
jgi:hypothetical protein